MPAEPFFADTDADLVDWNRLLLSSPAGSFVISSNWFSSLATYGFEAKYLLTRDAAGTLTGGAALAVFRMGSFSWIDVPHGPALRKKDDAALHALLQAIENYAERIRAAFVQISPFEPMPYEERWEREAAKHKLPYDPGLPRGANMGVGAALGSRVLPGRDAYGVARRAIRTTGFAGKRRALGRISPEHAAGYQTLSAKSGRVGSDG